MQGGKMRFTSRSLSWQIPLFTLVLAGGILASDEKPDTKEKMNVGGYCFWQFGQIIKGYDPRSDTIRHQWQNNVLVGFTFKARPSERLNLVISPEFFLNYPNPQKLNSPQSVYPLGATYINNAYGTFAFGDVENPPLRATIGMFTFMYNPDGRNFGNYLFRTGTYPTYIINIFDFPAARLLGLHVTSDAVQNLHADLLLTSEAFMFPLWDFSLTAIASYKLFNAVEFGAGVDFARVLPVMDTLTSPKYGTFFGGFNSYVTEDGDTAYYSFKATKVMARVSIDPKPFLSSLAEQFGLGPEDLKLYGEICWVGVEGTKKGKFAHDTANNADMHPWYNSLNERTPRMVGFNFPAFRILDVLSGEIEYFPSVIPNDYFQVQQSMSPVPYFKDGVNSYIRNDNNKGTWRWSIYAKKMVVQGLNLTGEAAFDHLRNTTLDGSTQPPESLTKTGHWHWIVKIGYFF
jgi:hypothetical protein